ncbi:hypothetical protein [Myroides fluvii]|uniref:hypothetical protein n=1 Tax=Myroides fluvii TaxID=2572594 RepID=UPI00131B3D6D|nr:hypothetical protein [Myroides fluvii]
MKKNTQPEIYYSDQGISLASPRAFFCDNSNYGSFVYDLEEQKKYLVAKKPKESEIVALSADGKQALTIDTTFDTRKRFIRIIEVETQEEQMVTKIAFGYEGLFSPVENLLVIRGDIKRKEKVFIYNWQTEEVVYTFPGAHPLTYGHLNEQMQTFVLPNPRKKAEAFRYDFQTGEGQVVSLPSNRLIYRLSLIDTETYFYIDGDYIATLYKEGQVAWQIKLDFDSSLHYAPDYFIKGNRVYFSYVYDTVVEGTEEEQACFYTIDVEKGKLEPILLPQNDLFGSFYPFIGNQVINHFGGCLDLNTMGFSTLGVEVFK